VHEFKASFNHFSLLDAMNLYSAAKRAWVPETLIYFTWFALSYPSIIKDDNLPLAALIQSNLNNPDPIDIANFDSWSACIQELRTGRTQLPDVTLEMGVPSKG